MIPGIGTVLAVFSIVSHSMYGNTHGHTLRIISVAAIFIANDSTNSASSEIFTAWFS